MILQPWHLLLMALASWLNRQQQAAIEYLREENRVLREKLGKKRILLSDDQRRRLALWGKALGHKLLSEIVCLFTPAPSWPGTASSSLTSTTAAKSMALDVQGRSRTSESSSSRWPERICPGATPAFKVPWPI